MTCRVVAEAGQTMMGRISVAIDQAFHAAEAGAWGLKVQLLQPHKVAQPDAPKYWTDTLGTANQREAFTRAGLVDYGEWAEVAAACADFGIEFLATPFDLDAVEALERIGVRYYKIASGDITYKQLIVEVARTGKQIILSTGAAFDFEIAQALKWCGTADVTLLACTLSYPTPVDAAHLARIETLRRSWPGHDIGYSDHTSLASAALASAALGSTLNEVHFTLDNDGPDVPDHRIAVNPDTLRDYVTAANLGAKLRGDGKIAPCEDELAARVGARRCVCAARDLPAGHRVTAEDFAFLRPAGGRPPRLAEQLVGTVLSLPVEAGCPLP